MDFIERIFGISPDNGSGLFELAFFLVPILILATFIVVGYTQGRRRT